MKKGLFITLEGFECSGKSTAAAYLTQYLEMLNVDYIKTREPGGTHVTEIMRELLLQYSNQMEKYTETTLFYAARIEHTAKIILPALDAGKIVVCDRYYDSTNAYQGALDGGFAQPLFNFFMENDLLIRPDVTLMFDIDYATFLRRKKARPRDDVVDIFEDIRDAEYHQKVIERFRDIAREDSERVVLIDSTQDYSSVRYSAISVLKEALKRVDFNL